METQSNLRRVRIDDTVGRPRRRPTLRKPVVVVPAPYTRTEKLRAAEARRDVLVGRQLEIHRLMAAWRDLRFTAVDLSRLKDEKATNAGLLAEAYALIRELRFRSLGLGESR